MLYSGYEEQIKDGLRLPMCILGGKALPEGAETGRCPAVVRREELEEFCAAEDVRLGISNRFTDVSVFGGHYYQADTALHLGSRLRTGERIFEYRRFQLYDLLENFGDRQRLRSFRHDAVELLRRYDRENDAALYETLRVYLDSGRSIKPAAERMFIHRNSMVYRLGKIADIGRVDLGDPETCLLLQLSFRIDDISRTTKNK